MSLKATTDKLQWVVNAAARVVNETWKYNCGLTDILRNEFHWLSVPQRVKFKLGIMIFRCLRHSVPRYLSDFCTPVANVAARSQLLSAIHHLVVVPRYNRSMYGSRAFSVAGPMTWNSLHRCPLTVFVVSSKHFCFIIRPCVFSALKIFLLMRYINRRFTYLLLSALYNTAHLSTAISRFDFCWVLFHKPL